MKRKFAVLGCGSIGKRHIQNLLYLGEKDIVGVDVDHLKCSAVENLFGISTANSFGQAFEMGANIVFIALPSAYHADALIQAIDYGCHVLVEKPLATKSEGLEELIERAGKLNLAGFMASNFKFHPSFQRMKVLIDGGKLGRVLSARISAGHYLPKWHPEKDYRQGYSANSAMGGGVLLDSHEINYLVWLLGPIKQVYCIADKISDLEIDVEDTASLIFKMESGAQIQLNLDYTQHVYQRAYEFNGTEGAIYWDINKGKVEYYSALKNEWEVWDEPQNYNMNDMYIEQTKHYLKCLDGMAYPLTPLSEGLYTLKVIEAAKLSNLTKRPVDLNQ